MFCSVAKCCFMIFRYGFYGYDRIFGRIDMIELLWVSVNGAFDVLFSLMLLSIIEKSGNGPFTLLSCLLNRVLVSFLGTSLKQVDALLVSDAVTGTLFSVLEFLKKVNVWSDFVSYLLVLSF